MREILPARSPRPENHPVLGGKGLEPFIFSAAHDPDEEFLRRYAGDADRIALMHKLHANEPAAQDALARLDELTAKPDVGMGVTHFDPRLDNTPPREWLKDPVKQTQKLWATIVTYPDGKTQPIAAEDYTVAQKFAGLHNRTIKEVIKKDPTIADSKAKAGPWPGTPEEHAAALIQQQQQAAELEAHANQPS